MILYIYTLHSSSSTVHNSSSPQRSWYTEPSLYPPSCTTQRPGFSTGSRSGYLSGFTNAACAPSLASNAKTMRQTKKSSREPACPALSPPCLRCIYAGLDMSQGWTIYASPKQYSLASSKKGCVIVCSKEAHKDQLKRPLAINHQPWWQEASDWDSWPSSVRKARHKFEAERQKAATEGRRKQKERAPSQLSSAKNFTCPKCSWVCTSTFRKSLSVWDQPSSSVLQSNKVQAVTFIWQTLAQKSVKALL